GQADQRHHQLLRSGRSFAADRSTSAADRTVCWQKAFSFESLRYANHRGNGGDCRRNSGSAAPPAHESKRRTWRSCSWESLIAHQARRLGRGCGSPKEDVENVECTRGVNYNSSSSL